MSRLPSEFARLYRVRPQDGVAADLPPVSLIDATGSVRAMVMELTGPPEWEILSRVWQGVQAELDLPAPAIAVSGIDGLQLWFSVADAIPVARAHAFLDGLRQRFLSDVAAKRMRLMPTLDATPQRLDLHAAVVPAQQPDSDNWSAFLAPDLVPIFADSPWLDIAPSEEGQASLLHDIVVMTSAAFAAAMTSLGSGADAQTPAPANRTDTSLAGVDQARSPGPQGDAAQFLLRVMNDASVDMALRVEAAKALLQHGRDGGRPRGG